MIMLMAGAPDLAVRQVFMVMPVLIQRECRCCLFTEQDFELIAGCYIGRCAVTADMAIQADHTVSLRHDNVKIMGNQHHTAIQPVADVLDQLVERNLAVEVDALNWFVENKKFW